MTIFVMFPVKLVMPEHIPFSNFALAIHTLCTYSTRLIMDDLRIWVNIVKSSKFKVGSELNLLLEPGTQMRRLYDAVASNQVYDEEDVSRSIPELGASDTLISKVKSKLKERLSEALLFMEFTDLETNDRQNAYVQCLKKWTAATILFSKNYRQQGIDRLEHLLRQTRRFEFTELSIDVLQTLRLHASITSGNEAEYLEYTAQLNQLQSIRHMEEQAETAYTELMIAFVNSRSDKREMADRARNANAAIAPLLAQCTTCRLHIYGRLIQIAIYDNQNDYAKVIELCLDAIRFFDQKPYKSVNALQVFHYSLLVSYLSLQAYDRCREVANEYMHIFQPGVYNWFKWNELYLLAELHAGHYEAAADIFRQVTALLDDADLPASSSEFWKIAEGYLYFLARCGRIKEKKTDKKFRVGKLLNEIQFAQRDKSGMNIPILIIQFLINLVENDYNQCLARQENMAKYRSRYLAIDHAARSHYFFRMLEFIPKSAFEPGTISLKAQPWLQKLQSASPEDANQNFEVEIIPYEALWTMVMGTFSKPQRVRATQ